MHEPISVVIPARNESPTISAVVAAFRNHPLVEEVIVVDSASDDDTGTLAAEHGARVIRLDQSGLGRAIKAGAKEASSKWIFKVDADMRNAAGDWLSTHVDALGESVGLVKSYWNSSEDPMPVTNLVVKPSIHLLIPSLSFIHMPISGIYLWDKSLLSNQELPDDFSYDLEVLIRINRLGYKIGQVFLGEVLDTLKPVQHYTGMATELLRCIQRQAEVDRSAPLMAIMAHPDDAEIWCGGTMSKVLNAGGVVHLWVMTGSSTRQHEATRLTAVYPNLRVRFLGGAEFAGIPEAAVDRLKDAIVQLRPRVLITHHFSDIHPDHRRCFELATAACMMVDRQFLPNAIYLCNSYYQTNVLGVFSPNAYIDIGAEAELKYRFIRFHESQDTDHWIRMARAIDELNGAKCGVQKAEAFQKITLYTTPQSTNFL